jgi:3',5'-cyclic-AMP phosphodiesterase
LDFSFTYRGVKFIFFDDNARGIDCCVPDFAWLESETSAAGDSLGIVTVSHAAPHSDQLDSASSDRMIGLFAKHKVKLSIHGHSHNYGYGVPYLIADDIGDRNYVTVTLFDTGLAVERIFF